MIFDLRFRTAVGSQQKAVALRDAISDDLTERGVTVISADAARQSHTYFVITDAVGELAQVEVEALDESDAVEQVKGKGTEVLSISETPMTPAGDSDE